MKAHVLEGINKLEYKDIPTPSIQNGEVLVRVRAAGICGSDIPRIFQTGTYHFPTIPGHEFAGEVVEATDKDGELWKGKRVGVFPLIPCKKCPNCLKKKYEMCSNYNYLGSRCDGGFAEYVAVPTWNLIELPDQVSFEEAALFEPASVALHAVRQLDLTGVKSVAILGLGTIGILIAEWLHILGVNQVIATGHHEEHGELMKKVASNDYIYIDANNTKVDEEILRITEAGVDAVFDCVGSSDSLADAISCVAASGQIIEVGNPKADVSLEKNTYWKILRKQLIVKGTWNSSFTHDGEDDWNWVKNHCQSKALNLKDLITHSFPFEQLEDGLEVMRNREVYNNKVMITQEDERRVK